MNDDDYLEIETIIYELIYDYIENNIILMSKPHFHEMLSEDMITTYLSLIKDVPFFEDEEIHEDLIWFIEYLCDEYFEIFEIPKRSYICTECDDKTPEQINIISKQINYLSNVKQPQQKTPEWYEFRHNLFTASSIWKIFGTEAQVNSIIYEKCKPYNSNNFIRSNSMDWGNFYEPISIQVYEHLYNTSVKDFGCIQHPDFKFIGASPDGINVDIKSKKFGRLIEIKNIVNREITDQPKEEYWTQMQLQMETCNLDECDFVETRFKEIETYGDFYTFVLTETHFCKGIILSFVNRNYTLYDHQTVEKKTESFIIYNDGENISSETIDDWITAKKETNKSQYLLVSIRYWYLDEFSCLLVKRNPYWFQSAVRKINSTWEIIQQEKITGYEHRNTKKKVSVTMDASSNSHIIKNMPNTNNICLIKLDTNGNIF
jgi:putative phage-type endonuclease